MAKKPQCRIRNWSQYNKSLVKRGHLTLWLEEESIQHWHQKPKTHGRRGRPIRYSDKVRQHGRSKRRTWRKLHLAIDEKTGEILSAALTSHNVGDSEMLPDLLEPIDGSIDQVSADGAYDSHANYALLEQRAIKATIPPRETAKIKQHGNYKEPALQRDENIREIRKVGKAPWKKAGLQP